MGCNVFLSNSAPAFSQAPLLFVYLDFVPRRDASNAAFAMRDLCSEEDLAAVLKSCSSVLSWANPFHTLLVCAVCVCLLSLSHGPVW